MPIKKFLKTNPVSRWFRSFLYHKVFQYSKVTIFLVVFVLVIFWGFLVFYEKENLEKAKLYILKYSLNLIHFDEHSYSKININGNKQTDREEIMAIIREELQKIEERNENNSLILTLKKRIEKLPWIEEVVVSRSLPNTLNIAVKEYEPFAIWQDGENKYIINKDGKVIKVNNIDDFDYLVILSGKGANLNAKSLFNILASDPEVSKNVYSAIWVGNRRWDIKFENGLLVKLPENNISEAWGRLIKIYNMPGSLIGLKVIDLRISKKIYLEYDEGSKDLKSL